MSSDLGCSVSASTHATVEEDWIRASFEHLLYRTMSLKKGRVCVGACCRIRIRDRNETVWLPSSNTGTRVGFRENPFEGVVEAVVRVRVAMTPAVNCDPEDVSSRIKATG